MLHGFVVVDLNWTRFIVCKGEKMLSWHEIDTVTFCEKITQFLNEHPTPSGKDNGSGNVNDNYDKVWSIMVIQLGDLYC